MAALKRFPNGRAQIAIRANRSATKHLIGPDGHVMCGLAAIWRSQRGGVALDVKCNRCRKAWRLAHGE